MAALAVVGSTGAAHAAEILVNADIAVATVWTSNNTYNLQDQIYVLPGATLTIQAGTVIASTTNIGGSLAVAKGAQIFALGTKENPIIWTSKADVNTWDIDAGHPTGHDPKTGAWREGCNEWGNLTLMGAAFISEDATAGNMPTCNAGNVAAMEGLVPDFVGDPKVLYGGGNDNDDSGTVSHCSFRYGGKVIALANELNGLSLGGIGRGTDIHHVEVMNNVDDGVEIWGGTVNLKYISIWNIGDDSFDIDQGYRGKVQFVLLVQGWSCDDAQGSGVGDNCFETDGAEQSDWQPVTTTAVWNATVIGQPIDGDGLTAWRDNARVQYHNCIFMDCGDAVVRFDNVDGDGGLGYGNNGTLTWAQTWTTAYNAAPAHANDCPPGTYQAQTSGKLAEIKDSVFFNNTDGAAYGEATARGVFAAANNNVKEPALSPISMIVRDAPTIKGGLVMQRVILLDPRAANDALPNNTGGFAPGDGFFSQAKYRGAFAPDAPLWICGWTAACAFDFLVCDKPCIGDRFCEGSSVANSTGQPGHMIVTGSVVDADDDLCLTALDLPPGPNIGYFIMGTGMNTFTPVGSAGPICVAPGIKRYLPPVNNTKSLGGGFQRVIGTQGNGHPVSVNITAGSTWSFQAWHRDGMNPSNLTDAVSVAFQ